MSDDHQSFINTPRQLIVVVVLAFLVPIVVIALIATYVRRRSEPAPVPTR